jgi:hypothetical protein
MAGISPGLDGYIAAQQLGQQRQAQELGMLSKILQMRQMQDEAAANAEMRPLQMDALRAQIAERNAKAEGALMQRNAQGALSRLQLTGGYTGQTVAPATVAQDDNAALAQFGFMKGPDGSLVRIPGTVDRSASRDEPGFAGDVAVNVPSQPVVRALTSMAFPDAYGKEQAASLFPKPVAPVAPSGVMKLIQERDALPVGDPRRAILDQAITKQTTQAPAASVTVNNKQESEFGKTVGKEFGDIYTGIIKAEFNAPKTIANYDRIGNLLSEVNTGKFAGGILELKAAAKSLGVDLTAMGIKDDVVPGQAVKQISNMLALELRNPAGGAGMPGALSDSDRKFLVESIPGIENDPGAIKEMIKYRKLLAKRDQDVGRMAREYRLKNGTFDEGFFDELRVFSEKNPLFSQTTAPAPSAAPATGGVRRYNPATGRIE